MNVNYTFRSLRFYHNFGPFVQTDFNLRWCYQHLHPPALPVLNAYLQSSPGLWPALQAPASFSTKTTVAASCNRCFLFHGAPPSFIAHPSPPVFFFVTTEDWLKSKKRVTIHALMQRVLYLPNLLPKYPRKFHASVLSALRHRLRVPALSATCTAIIYLSFSPSYTLACNMDSQFFTPRFVTVPR